MNADAWKQHHDLLERFTRRFEPRNDLAVVAHACDRSVELSLGTPRNGRSLLRYNWHSTKRNVRTMRELAEALLAACDFVEEMNPTWALHLTEPVDV